MTEYGLIGKPLGHSFSRRFFTQRFAAQGRDARYLNFELDSIEELPAMLASHPELRGFNVTSPYKRAVIPCLDEVTGDASAIQAVNAVVIGDDGRLVGHNTDVAGFRFSLGEMLKGGESRGLILGTGGAADAVALAMSQLGIQSVKASRKPADGQTAYSEITPEMLKSFDVIVNATPLGMEPHVGEAPDIPYDAIEPRQICHDLVYNPQVTEFMHLCGLMSPNVRGGLKMLKKQAEEAAALWGV